MRATGRSEPRPRESVQYKYKYKYSTVHQAVVQADHEQYVALPEKTRVLVRTPACAYRSFAPSRI